ncbi:hypothetical protein AJE_16379 [Alishewanella jeotgali KCTC 22429]|uniref:Uncharacterized protein n=1 Tax=Alishewanella jeotgali KCTC 22429 TaxID=1129374 RepID=H3ZIR3_9ALTE|nr:hypothetical protein AJE_16379 [Alishewanella jeotgali KCTC 22429]
MCPFSLRSIHAAVTKILPQPRAKRISVSHDDSQKSERGGKYEVHFFGDVFFMDRKQDRKKTQRRAY